MNRTHRALLPLLALFICLSPVGGNAHAEEKVEDVVGAVKWLGRKISHKKTAPAQDLSEETAQEPAPFPPPPPEQQPVQLLQPQQIRPGSQDNLYVVSDLNRQTAFLDADQNRINELLKRAASIVRTRYMQVVRPAIPLGRLLRVPFCGGAAGRGVLVPGQIRGTGVVTVDRSTYPNFENCGFVFETYAPEAGDAAPLDTQNQTALFANIRLKLAFDAATGQQLAPSNLRAQAQPLVRWQIELTTEPYVYQSLPNVPPPLSLSGRKLQKPNWPGASEVDSLEDHRDFGFSNINAEGLANRLATARGMIEGHDGGIANLASVREAPLPSPGFDPCGETPVPSIGFLAQTLIVDHCYTYSARVLLNQRPDPRYLGQLRVRYQKDPRTGKIIGVRGFSFGGNI